VFLGVCPQFPDGNKITVPSAFGKRHRAARPKHASYLGNATVSVWHFAEYENEQYGIE
jgi:hypothetical protein